MAWRRRTTGIGAPRTVWPCSVRRGLVVATLCCLAAAKTKPSANTTRGFLLAATRTPVKDLRRKPSGKDDLGALLRDVCATPYPARLVVGDASEQALALKNRPCTTVDVAVYQHPGGRRLTDVHLRYFKVGAIASSLPLYTYTLSLDNDVALRRGAVDELFAIFDVIRKNGKALGLSGAHVCAPRQHKLKGVSSKFCERNSGMIFFAEPARSAKIAAAWLRELEHHTSKDGHDQMPLRKVLYANRDHLYDVPKKTQCRGRSGMASPCSGRPLIWHAHKADRVRWARAHQKGAAEVCGFVV
mmetsp:Transcript_35076/g.105681  ORF Transcript_35076/g.105681 Transcript_35076/m.105681 type:complete len:300 (+) Transcript_35076:516-1415(+)